MRIEPVPGSAYVAPDLDSCGCDDGVYWSQECCGRYVTRGYSPECCGDPDRVEDECGDCLGGRRRRDLSVSKDQLERRLLAMAKKEPGDLPTAVDAKWARAAMEPGVPVDMGDVVVCDLCMRDYRGDPASGGLIFQSMAVCPDCAPAFDERVHRAKEGSYVRARCPSGVSFQRFVLDYRTSRGSNSICISNLGDLNKLREYIADYPPEVVPGDGWTSRVSRERMAAAIDRAFVGASDHPYTCRCDDCLTWWAKMGPDDGEYGPFARDEVNARQRDLGIEETP